MGDLKPPGGRKWTKKGMHPSRWAQPPCRTHFSCGQGRKYPYKAFPVDFKVALLIAVFSSYIFLLNGSIYFMIIYWIKYRTCVFNSQISRHRRAAFKPDGEEDYVPPENPGLFQMDRVLDETLGSLLWEGDIGLCVKRSKMDIWLLKGQILVESRCLLNSIAFLSETQANHISQPSWTLLAGSAGSYQQNMKGCNTSVLRQLKRIVLSYRFSFFINWLDEAMTTLKPCVDDKVA